MSGEWISVEDRLPERRNTDLLATDGKNRFIAHYNLDGTGGYWWGDGTYQYVTHWQPLPPPPNIPTAP